MNITDNGDKHTVTVDGKILTVYDQNEFLLRKLVEIRLANPHRRFPRLFSYARNGSQVSQMACNICGEYGPTWCAQWPKTRTAKDWELEHRDREVSK